MKVNLPSDQEASGRTLGQEELAAVQEAILSGILTSTKGKFVRMLEKQFAEKLGSRHAYACASGTAAIHTAIAAIDPEPGDEIVTSPITDMGGLAPILYQGAIPVFAEVDPRTCNVMAKTIEPCLGERTRAIIVTHLFGNPCEMDEIMELATAHQIPVVEDCAQAFLARYRDRHVGTIGKIGCFSLQQGKHMTTGEGGLLVTDDDELARRIFLYINKAWGFGDTQPDHYFLALNYRMSELQGAVAVGQLPKLDSVVQKRIASANQLNDKLSSIPGVDTPYVSSNGLHSYWKYCFSVDERRIPGGSVALGAQLRAREIACAPRYIQKPAFMCQIFRDRRTFGNSQFPFTLARPEILDYNPERFPLTMKALNDIIVLPWNENYQEQHVEIIARGIDESVRELRR